MTLARTTDDHGLRQRLLHAGRAESTITHGQTARFTLTLKAIGLLKTVKLTADGRLANRVSFSRNPARIRNGRGHGRDLDQDAPGLVTLRFTGVSGAVKHSVVVTLSLR